MIYKKQKGSGLKTFMEEYGPLALLFALPLSMVLCLLQYLIKSKSMLFLIIGSLVSGPPLLIFSLKALVYKELRNFTTFAMGILGAALLIWAGFLIFKPASQITTKTRMLFETRSKAVSVKDIDVSLDISPTTYHPGDKRLISMRVKNNSKHELILDSVMFETKKKFFDGFVVNYESAVPPISERKEKLGVSIALFFGEEQIHILPDQAVDLRVEIVANIPGGLYG